MPPQDVTRPAPKAGQAPPPAGAAKAETVKIVLDAGLKARLLVPFAGLPFKGELADPKLMTLWLLRHQQGATGREVLDAYEPNALRAASATVQETFHERLVGGQLMRWVHRLFGSDLIGLLILLPAYAAAWRCWWEFRRRQRHFESLRGWWQTSPPPPPDAPRHPDDRPPSRQQLLAPGEDGDVMARADRYLARVASERASDLEDTGDGDLEALPHKVLFAAVVARRRAARDDDPVVARGYFADGVRKLMEAYDNRLSEVHYFTQMIAPLGFIGTVLHLGLAMGHAQSLTSGGGIGEVTSSLSMAFDTTFVALALWLVVEYGSVKERSARLQVRDEAEAQVERSVFAGNTWQLNRTAAGEREAHAPGSLSLPPCRPQTPAAATPGVVAARPGGKATR